MREFHRVSEGVIDREPLSINKSGMNNYCVFVLLSSELISFTQNFSKKTR